MSDRRCKLGLRARLEIAQAVEAGATQAPGGAAVCGVAGDGQHDLAALARRVAGRAPERRVSGDASAGPSIVSVGAGRGGRAGDPRRARAHELGADAVGRVGRPASRDDLEGASPSRRQRTSPRRASDASALPMGRRRRAVAHRRAQAAEVRPARPLGHRAARRRAQDARRGPDRRHRRRRRPHPAGLLRAAQRRATVWMREQGCGPVQRS